jgi:hypothetical protein
MADFNSLLGSAISTVNQSSEGMSKLAGMLAGNTQQLMQLSTANANIGQEQIVLAADAAAKKAAIGFTQDSMREATQNILNINPAVADNELQRSTNMLNASQAEYKAARGEYDKIAQTSLLDDPLGYIFGQLKLPSVAARVNAASDAQAAAEDNINTRLNIAKNHASTVVANTAASMQEANLVQASADAKMGQFKLQQAEMENSSRIAGQLIQQSTLQDRISDNKVKIVQMQLAAANAEASREAAAAARQNAGDLRAERLAKIKAEDEATGRLNTQLQRVGQFLGMPEILSTTTLKRFNPKQQQALMEAASSNNFGDDLTSALSTFSQLPGKGNMATTNPGVAKFIDKIGSNLSKYESAVQADFAKTNMGQKMPAKAVAGEAVQQYQFDIASSASKATAPKSMSSPEWDTTFNPFKAQHKVLLDEVAAGKLPSLANNAMVTALQTVATTADATTDNLSSKEEQRALRVVRDMVASRKLSPADAATQIASYYRVAAAKNSDLYQYQVFGLQQPKHYYMGMEAVGTFGKVLKADMLNPTSIENALMKDLRGTDAAGKAIFGQSPEATQQSSDLQAAYTNDTLFKFFTRK